MTAIDRTAYPRPGTRLTREELSARYDLTETDLAFIRTSARGDSGRLALAMLLKTRRDFGCFAAPAAVHPGIVDHLAAQLGNIVPQAWADEVGRTKSLYRYQTAARSYLSVTPYGDDAEQMVSSIVLDAAATMSDPADLINRAVEALQSAAIDLPAFSTLDRLVNRLRAEVHGQIYDRVAGRIASNHAAMLDALLIKPPDSATTGFSRLKQTPGPATPKTVRLWTNRLEWLDGLIDPDPLLEGVTHTKLRQFAAEAAALEVSDLIDIAQSGKRHTLLLALLRQVRMRCRDELIEMMLRRIRRTQAMAKEQLDDLHEQHRAIEENLIGIFGQVLETEPTQDNDAAFGRQVRKLLSEQGGVAALAQQCETVSAWHRGNDLPLLWPIHAKHRVLPFRLLDLMVVQSATQDHSLLEALAIVSSHRHARRNDVPGGIDLAFASLRWQAFVARRRSEPGTFDRRALEVCVFVHLADALQSGDLYVVGAETFADYRAQLLPWTECEARLPAYCATLGIPERGDDFAAMLKAELTTLAADVDAGFPTNTEFSLDADGMPHLKQLGTTAQPAGLPEFEQEIRARMPERHLLDILKHAEHWSRYTRHFGPPSGSDPKLVQAVQRYLFTVFGYGCNLGPGQTARHAPDVASAQSLRRINAQHISANKLEAAMVDVIDQYARFPLPRHWGSGRAAIADGTHVKLRENNLLGSQHVRYGAYGGIAYHHIADNYIALFTSFIPCGVWEAVHILDGLLKNQSEIQPDTLHADTQGQSEPVFGLCRLLGIKLMPRMRGLGDVTFYRPAKSIRYEHIDALFTSDIDWDLIATHARDMIQVVLSIQAGRVMPSMLLRKLGTYNRRNLLYRAFREVGRVERTLFLLRFFSNIEIRRVIRAETTKIEAFNDFLDWVSFGGPVIKSGDPVEQEKQLKYASLVANTIMLSNVADLTAVLSEMAADGHPVTPALVASLSPYTRAHILRFGQYALDMENLPGPLDPQPLPFENAL
ncbi:Tn3 family transposase [Acidisphaera sp. S103]|uniref:Tn3 family transposase n=1 Tax=Acidisphaera sp. S103 TaxID=1747223 RepID=UPI00131DC146|nr:Tn3 family transposase [Acidisphaera sp. S103]